MYTIVGEGYKVNSMCINNSIEHIFHIPKYRYYHPAPKRNLLGIMRRKTWYKQYMLVKRLKSVKK
jgi:hypothetical protein